jgi:hypothetical protein
MKVIRRVTKAYGEPVVRVKEEAVYRLEARNVALWLVWERCGLSLRQMGSAHALHPGPLVFRDWAFRLEYFVKLTPAAL